MRTALKIAIRACTIFGLLVGVIGGLVGAIAGIGYGIFLIDKHFHWGQAGIAIMTLLVVFGVASILIAVSDEHYGNS